MAGRSKPPSEKTCETRYSIDDLRDTNEDLEKKNINLLRRNHELAKKVDLLKQILSSMLHGKQCLAEAEAQILAQKDFEKKKEEVECYIGHPMKSELMKWFMDKRNDNPTNVSWNFEDVQNCIGDPIVTTKVENLTNSNLRQNTTTTQFIEQNKLLDMHILPEQELTYYKTSPDGRQDEGYSYSSGESSPESDILSHNRQDWTCQPNLTGTTKQHPDQSVSNNKKFAQNTQYNECLSINNKRQLSDDSTDHHRASFSISRQQFKSHFDRPHRKMLIQQNCVKSGTPKNETNDHENLEVPAEEKSTINPDVNCEHNQGLIKHDDEFGNKTKSDHLIAQPKPIDKNTHNETVDESLIRAESRLADNHMTANRKTYDSPIEANRKTDDSLIEANRKTDDSPIEDNSKTDESQIGAKNETDESQIGAKHQIDESQIGAKNQIDESQTGANNKTFESQIKAINDIDESRSQSIYNIDLKVCKKKPGHLNFVPVDQFNVDHLPPGYHDNDLVDLVRAMSDLTVCVSVNYVSDRRPETFPGTGWPYPCYNDRGSNLMRVATGRVCWVKKYSNEGETCGCKMCHLFFDRRGTPDACSGDVTLNGGSRVWSDVEGDMCYMTYVTHDLDLTHRLEKMVGRYESLCLKYEELCARRTQLHQFPPSPYPTILVSYPHGCSKQVSVGWAREPGKKSPHRKKRIYTTATCLGSS